MILYGAPVSPFVRKVLAFAAEKGVALELVPIGLGDQNPDFLACSPFRKMPGFTDGDFSISDSTAIVSYIDAKHPEVPLIPADPANRARAGSNRQSLAVRASRQDKRSVWDRRLHRGHIRHGRR